MPRKKQSLNQIKFVLLRDKMFMCKKCGHYSGEKKDIKQHAGTCLNQPSPSRMLLSLTGSEFICQMGCQIEGSDTTIIKHMITTHTEEELEKWGLSRLRLEKMLLYRHE